jgi:hypothetical protein
MVNNLYVEAHALYTGKSVAEVESETTPEAFESHLRALHERYMANEFSFGRFTELAEVAHLELREILDALGLTFNN